MTDVEVLKEIYRLINRGDVAAAVEHFASDVERIEPTGHDTAGTFHGKAAVLANMAKGRGTWAEGACSPEDFAKKGDRIVALLYVRVRLKDKTDWIEGRFADGFIFREGKVVFMQTFWERADALAWAGIPPGGGSK